ncbi:MAG: tetratricopeptide repeat protein [Caldilineaceae bacterium]
MAGAAEERATLGLALQRQAELARLQRHYAECDTLLYAARALFADDHPAQAYGLFVAGKAAFDQHDLAAATVAFTQALRLWEAAGNSSRAALCIQNLGRIAVARGEPQMAIPLYEQAIELLAAAGDLSNLAIVQMNLGIAYYECRQYDDALALYERAEAGFHTMNDDRYLAMVYNNLGLVYTALNAWNEAELNLRHSIELHQRVGDNKAWISTKSNLGIAYLNQAHYIPAIQILQEALTELQATDRDPEYERLQQDLTMYLALAQTRHVEDAVQRTPQK